MNRIILIGNGFDLAHGLKTKYSDFLDWLWKKQISYLINNNTLQTEYCFITRMNFNERSIINSLEFTKLENYNQLRKHLFSFGNVDACPYIEFKNHLLGLITEKHITNWVDIEEEYYLELVRIHKGESKNYKDISKLNEDLDCIKKELEIYLKTILSPTFNSVILKKLLFPIKTIDLSNFHSKKMLKDIISSIVEPNKLQINRDFTNDENYYIEKIRDKEYESILSNHPELVTIIISNSPWEALPSLFKPRNLLFLNFNYTSTEHTYLSPMRRHIQSIHIHGVLNDLLNPMIFGYGDELSVDYQDIENRNDNEYLKNVKSINYLQTDNYKKLLRFVESEPYQIFIMGHSCGISDRTLLNTLFEHENCASIKVYYHGWKNEDGSVNDNYTDVIQNISRNFKNKSKMRDVVVNKGHCEPLVDI